MILCCAGCACRPRAALHSHLHLTATRGPPGSCRCICGGLCLLKLSKSAVWSAPRPAVMARGALGSSHRLLLPVAGHHHAPDSPGASRGQGRAPQGLPAAAVHRQQPGTAQTWGRIPLRIPHQPGFAGRRERLCMICVALTMCMHLDQCRISMGIRDLWMTLTGMTSSNVEHSAHNKAARGGAGGRRR